MKKAIVINIPEPCHENWAEMNATEKGKFCGVCTKEVIDLSAKTDENLVKLFSGNKNVCGRFKKSQLNREVKMERKSGINFGPIAASFMLPLSIMANNITGSDNAAAKKPFISIGIGSANNGFERAQVITTGIITDQNGKPLRNVEIKSNETGAREWSNYKGEYRIVTLDHEILTFQVEDFISQTITLATKSTTFNIQMNKEPIIEHAIMGKMIATPVNKTEVQNDIITTKGVVTDDNGLPLPGVNVIIFGKNEGTQTDFDGYYTIKSLPNEKLIFSYVGFMSEEATLSNIDNTINITMGDGMVMGGMMMGEVVITQAQSDSYSPIFPFGKPEFVENPEAEAKRGKRKQATANTNEFKRIKKERRKKN